MALAVGVGNVVNPDNTVAPVRKRRRRTAASGAAEDCFTCRKRLTTCDRVRPFCGPCLEMGKECSGYRTVLTWGVGVASRGKLRGLSLPIPVPRLKTDTTSKKDSKVEVSPTTITTHQPKKPQGVTNASPQKRKRPNIKTETDVDSYRSSFSGNPSAFGSYSEWQSQHGTAPSSAEPSTTFTSHPQSNQNLRLTTDPILTNRLPLLPTPSLSSSLTGTSYNNSPWEQQSDFSASSETPTFVDPFDNQPRPPHHYKGPSNRPILLPQSFISHVDSQPTSPNEMNIWSNGVYTTQNISDPDSQSISSPPYEEENNWPFIFSPLLNKTDCQFELPVVPEDEWNESSTTVNALVPSISPSSFDMPFFHLPRRMQELLDYYDKSICPILVAFDDTSNPYRFHIMHFAMQNPGLQNALAALVTNNIRMKGIKHVPRLKYEQEAAASASSSKPTPEEQHYKAMSIQQLNSQLADITKASDDSVLATLLILCLFHVCNSGFSKFKTQLAGVQKLLRMRTREARSDFVGWVEMFFAWFDVMTSAVNDRETEIRGDSLDMMDLTANLGALERFSGCDGRLFKLIARLGRLNLLSQRRPVRFDLGPQVPRFRTMSDPEGCIKASSNDNRENFWSEWHDIRERLYAWRFTPSEQSNELEQMSLTQRNLEDISESFRYSALLYTERLGYPQLPSSSNNFQVLVGQSLSRIEAIGINSCVTKFMLWPLFITGTECVDERDRDLIRKRCIEIQQESGFYNNLSGLHVLERVWRENDANGSATMQLYSGQAFQWRKAMDRVDGEYIVI